MWQSRGLNVLRLTCSPCCLRAVIASSRSWRPCSTAIRWGWYTETSRWVTCRGCCVRLYVCVSVCVDVCRVGFKVVFVCVWFWRPVSDSKTYFWPLHATVHDFGALIRQHVHERLPSSSSSSAVCARIWMWLLCFIIYQWQQLESLFFADFKLPQWCWSVHVGLSVHGDVTVTTRTVHETLLFLKLLLKLINLLQDWCNNYIKSERQKRNLSQKRLINMQIKVIPHMSGDT